MYERDTQKKCQRNQSGPSTSESYTCLETTLCICVYVCVRRKQNLVWQDNVQKSCNHWWKGCLCFHTLKNILCVCLVDQCSSFYTCLHLLPPLLRHRSNGPQLHLFRCKINWIQWRPTLLKFVYVGPHTPMI